MARSADRPRDGRGLLLNLVDWVAWAFPAGQDLGATTLMRALGTWFGQPAGAPD